MKLFVGDAPAFGEYSTRSTRGPLALFVGGLVLGFGMQCSGSCPGTVFVQVKTKSLLLFCVCFVCFVD
jgi:uncharacterized membrane protein YedE/YeeE